MEPVANAVVTVGFLSGIIAYLIEWARGRFPQLDGDIIRAVAVAAGIGLAFGYSLNVAADLGFAGLPDSLGKVATGLSIAFGSGLIASWKDSKRSEISSSALNGH